VEADECEQTKRTVCTYARTLALHQTMQGARLVELHGYICEVSDDTR
jgi:hypothetical protein